MHSKPCILPAARYSWLLFYLKTCILALGKAEVRIPEKLGSNYLGPTHQLSLSSQLMFRLQTATGCQQGLGLTWLQAWPESWHQLRWDQVRPSARSEFRFESQSLPIIQNWTFFPLSTRLCNQTAQKIFAWEEFHCNSFTTVSHNWKSVKYLHSFRLYLKRFIH